MKDIDIIKALECCTKGNTSDVCVDCPLRTTDICTEEENGVLKLALDLINRQKAEIERLQGCVKSEDEVREIMKSQMSPMVAEITAEQIEKARILGRVEAVIEFDERLKKLSSSSVMVDGDREIPGTRNYSISEIRLDNLVKKMTEPSLLDKRMAGDS